VGGLGGIGGELGIAGLSGVAATGLGTAAAIGAVSSSQGNRLKKQLLDLELLDLYLVKWVELLVGVWLVLLQRGQPRALRQDYHLISRQWEARV
jgi:hypothetical protein